MGKEDPAKKGVCSNFLCDSKPGDDCKMTGPSGKVMLMPYRGFIRRLFTENTAAGQAYKGVAWLFLGVANSDALLYDEEWQAALESNPDNFKLDYALSREQINSKGGKMYIQDKVEEYADEIFDRLEKGAVMYFCGLKGMMPGIQDMLRSVCAKKSLDYDDFISKLKKGGQWRVEVY
jgi:ferredoxin--NADP+ reductase